MSIYFWFFFLIIFSLSIIARKENKSNQTRILYSIVAFTFLFFGFRIGFTPDYYAYEDRFKSEIWYGFSTKLDISREPLFSLMAATIPYRIALLIQTALICLCMYITLKRYIPVLYWAPAIAFLFLNHSFMLGNFSAFRSSFVTIAFFFAFVLREKSVTGFIVGAVLIAASSLIHQSGIILLAPYLICTRKPYNQFKYAVFFILAFIAVVFMYTRIQEMNLLAASMVEDNFSKFQYYMEDTVADRELHFTSFVQFCLFFYTALFLREKLQPIEHMFVFQTCIFIMLLIIPQLGMIARFQYYFIFPAAIGMILVFRHTKNQVLKYVYAACWTYLVLRSLLLFLNAWYVARTYAFYDSILFY